MDIDDRIQEAMQKTELIRAPKRRLATFGSTTMEYYVVTELTEQMSAVRDGQVLAERPRIVTPYYLLHVEGFSESARRFLGIMAQQNPHEAGIFYTYRNEPHSMNVVSEPLGVVVGNLSSRLESEDRPLSAIIRGVEDVWDLAVMMFIYDLTRRAAGGNYADFQRHGLLNMDESGLPAAARQQIELLFAVAREDRSRASQLVTELNRWGVYQEYEDRFLALFKR